VAIWVALQGQSTVHNNSQSTLRQSQDAQLSTAITALGSGDTAERIAGLLLLRRNTVSRLTLVAETGEPPSAVYGDYTTALQVLSGYLRSHGDTISGFVEFGRGYGTPNAPGILPIDLNYAADQVKLLVNSQSEKEVGALNTGQRPAIDLSYDELFRQSWSGVNFAWLTAYMPGIDLRGADLAFSKWGKDSDLSGSYLQCADLRHADFQGADLTGADLRGANVEGADFVGAHIRGAHITSVYGTAKWPRWFHHITVLPGKGWNPDTCVQDKEFWDTPKLPSTGKG
jgi:hypothetical protein